LTVASMVRDSQGSPVPRAALQAALFDWDGTLLDALGPLRASWREASLAVLGRRFPDTADEERTIFTLPGVQIWPQLAPQEDQRRALVEAFHTAYEGRLDQIVAFDGVLDALRKLRTAGIAIAIVTSKARRRYTLDAQRSGLGELVDVAICAEDADGTAKPDPLPVLRALQGLGVDAGRAVMVGDTTVDIQAGLAAGTDAVGVGWGAFGAPELLATGARAVAGTPEDLVEVLLG
jgi:phosphoglycolate phosphatase